MPWGNSAANFTRSKRICEAVTAAIQLKMAKPSVVVVGSSNTDMIVKVDRLPQAGETILGGEFANTCGGKGANQAVGAARAGGDVTFIARVGHDTFGQMALHALRANGIN